MMPIMLKPLPDDGTLVTVTTTDCEVDWIMLEVFKGNRARYNQAIEINGDTEFPLPSGACRFAFHYQNTTGRAVFNCSVKTPSREEPFPDEPSDGSDTAGMGEPGLTEFRVVV